MLSRRKFIAVSGATLALSMFSPKKAHAQSLRLRRDITTMAPDDPFFQEYSEAVRIMHELPEEDPRSWRNQAIIHANYCPHGGLDFLQWHRHYITFFEEICGELIGDPSFALGYWNWSNNQGRIPSPFFEDGPLNVEFWNDPSNYTTPSGSQTRWGEITTVGVRGLTETRGLQDFFGNQNPFTEDEIETILRQTNFSFFTGLIEGQPHNTGHGISGIGNGHMANGLSPLDPIFWLHHCNVDRIWAEWQSSGNTTPSNSAQYNQQFSNAQGNLVDVAADDTSDFNGMGFTYETTRTSLQPITLMSGRRFTRAIPQQDEVMNVLGKATNTKISKLRTVTSIPVETANLSNELFGSRSFNRTNFLSTPQTAIEESRILAVFKDVTPPSSEKAPILVNVFVDCPYLNAQTSTDDRHYAGTFSFFGGTKEFVVDITSTLRYALEQGIMVDQPVNIQLLPFSTDSDVDTQIVFGSVELVRV